MEAESNWVVESVVDLSETIQESNIFPEVELAYLLDEDKCFSLTRPKGSNTWCHIKIRGGDVSPGTRKVIKGLLLHSEARVVEVYAGEHEEYIKTEHGRRLGEYEDTEMSACEVRLKPPRREVKLAFKHTYNPNCVWVFGLHVITETVNVESRFGSGHLSSVLREKEVNVSKDGARLLHFLESFNGGGGDKFNENNNMALISMFLGQMVKNESSGKSYEGGKAKNCVKQSEPKAAAKKDGQSQRRNSLVLDSDEANINHVENRVKELAIREEGNGNEEHAAEGNNNTGGNAIQDPRRKSPVKTSDDDRNSKHDHLMKPQANISLENYDMIEKLFALMGNVAQGNEEQNTQEQYGRIKSSLPSPAAFASLLQPSTPSPQAHTMESALMESRNMKSAATNNFHPSHSGTPGPVHSTPRAKESDNNIWPGNDVSGGFSLEGSGLLLREIENIIERKFALMEERLIKRIEDKIAEKNEIDKRRLERIEEHCLKLCEHLLR